MARGREVTPVQVQRERALLYTLIADVLVVASIAIAASASGSLTMGAELVRTALMTALEVFSLIAMRRIHRGLFAAFEYGHGKIETLANIGIAIGLLVGGILIFTGALSSLSGSPHVLSPLGLAIGAVVASVNTCENFLAWAAMRRAAKVEANAILNAQMRARWVKLVSSVVVQVAMTIAAITYDTVIAHWLDGLGALFVAGFMVITAIDMMREGIPDILDRGVDEAAQLAILRVLGIHFESFAKFHGMRTRRASGQIFVEVELGYPEDLPLAEIDRRRKALEESLRNELGDCDVAIKIRSEPAAPALHE